ncbi:ATP-binding protein [Streptomyces sp. NPDC020681]|uniref:ATP-binding protein n=1 Tax=Streptomyces sp. NPDC020681 TaxID=3365083 RepID=UPI00379E749F
MLHPSEKDHDPIKDGSARGTEQVRDVTRGFLLVSPEGGSAVDTALLVVSELFANAVRHASGATGFELEAGPGTVVVDDASPVPPRPLPLDASKPGGFGWHLFPELSVGVQVETHSAGKTVTALVPCPTVVTPKG